MGSLVPGENSFGVFTWFEILEQAENLKGTAVWKSM